MSLLVALLLVVPPASSEQPSPPPLGVPAPAPLADGVDVHFLSYYGDDDYRVTVDAKSCETPCTLVLEPGPKRVDAVGNGELHGQFVVPHKPSQVRIAAGAPRWYTPAGAVMVPLGLLIGASLWAIGFACGFGPNSGGCFAANVIAWPIFGVALTVTGAVLLGLSNRTIPSDANRAEVLDD